MHVFAVDYVGNRDPHPRVLKWTTLAAATEDGRATSASAPALVLEEAPNSNSSIVANFRFSGWSKDFFLWRLDGGLGRWEVARKSHLSIYVSPGRLHMLEFYPAGLDGLRHSRPSVHTWSVLERGSLLTLYGLHDGLQTLAVRAVDSAGNVQSGNITSSWVVDTTPPTVCHVEPVGSDAGKCTKQKVLAAAACTVKVTGEDEPLSRVWLYQDAAQPKAHLVDAHSNSVTLSVPSRIQSFKLRLEDLMGNISPSPCIEWSWTYVEISLILR